MKWQEHTNFKFSKVPKEAVGIVFGIPGYPPLPATVLWTKTLKMPGIGIIITSTREEEMPTWQRLQYADNNQVV